MDLCAAEPGCVSVDFVARTGDHVLKTCDLYLSGGGEAPSGTCATSKFLS